MAKKAGGGRINLRIKLMAMFFAMNVISVLLLGVTSYVIASGTIKEKVSENIGMMASQIAFSTDTAVDNVNRLLDFLFTDTELQDVLSGRLSATEGGKSQRIHQILDSYFVNAENLLACILLDAAGGRYTYKNNVSDRAIVSQWAQQAIEQNGRIHWLGSYALEEMTLWSDRVLVVARALKDLADQDVVQPIGTVILVYSDRILSDIFRSVGEETVLMIIDGDNRTVRSTQIREHTDEAVLQYTAENPEARPIPFDIHLDGAKFMMSIHDVPACGWRVVEAIPYYEINKNFIYMQTATLVVALFSMISLVVLSLFFSRKITFPLRALNREMKKVSGGDFQVHQFPPERTDEVGQIQRGFNEMVDRMQELLHTTVEKEKEKQLVELTALQYQVNPHFLYNSLNSIRLMAMMSRPDDIVGMLDSLIRLLRKSAGKSGTMIPLREEMETVADFIGIHQVRYQCAVVIDDRLQADTLDCLVPCFLIQPLVENALFHGFEGDAHDARLSFNGKREDGFLTLVVEDNGVGMTEDRIRQVLSGARPDRLAFVSVGVKNVDDRLKIRFGPEYGLTLESAPGVGTRVTIRLPAIDAGTATPDTTVK